MNYILFNHTSDKYKYYIEIYNLSKKIEDYNFFIHISIDIIVKEPSYEQYIEIEYSPNNTIRLKNIYDNMFAFSFVISDKIQYIKIKFDFDEFILKNHRIEYLDLDMYTEEIGIILLEYINNIEQHYDLNNKKSVKDLFFKLIDIRKIIGKHSNFCHIHNCHYDNDIKLKYLNILEKTKKYLQIFNNENYYYNEIKNIITNNKIKNIKYCINTITKNIIFFEKIFNDFNKTIKLYETKINELSNFNDNECLELYFSPISQTNWIESLQENQIVGLLIRTKPLEDFILSKNIDSIDIVSLTRSTIDLDMFFSFVNQYYNNYNSYDNGLGQPMIKGNGIGEGNTLLPIYINPLHWKLGFKLAPIFCGIGTTNNPGLYIKTSLYLYHKVLLEMILETFINKNIDDKWLNLLFTIYKSTIEINNLCENFDWDEFIDKPITRIKPSLTQILSKLLLDQKSFDMMTNNEKFVKLIKIILEESIRRITITDADIKNILNYDLLEVIDNNFTNRYNINNDTILRYKNNIHQIISVILFLILIKQITNKPILEFINDFVNNNSLLKHEHIHLIKEFIKNNTSIFDLEQQDVICFINPLYSKYNHNFISNEKKFKIDCINKVISKLSENIIDKKQFEAMILQNTIQNSNKCRRIAIEKNKYNDPFEKPDIVHSFCNDYIIKRNIYREIETIKTKEEYFNSKFYNLYQNNEYKYILEHYIKNNIFFKNLIMN